MPNRDLNILRKPKALFLLLLFLKVFVLFCLCVCGFLRIYFILLLLFWPLCMACGILVPQPGIEPVPLH